jgi:hypothetical protein
MSRPLGGLVGVAVVGLCLQAAAFVFFAAFPRTADSIVEPCCEWIDQHVPWFYDTQPDPKAKRR